MSCHVMSCHVILYYIIVYYSILYYIILHYIILYYIQIGMNVYKTTEAHCVNLNSILICIVHRQIPIHSNTLARTQTHYITLPHTERQVHSY